MQKVNSTCSELAKAIKDPKPPGQLFIPGWQLQAAPMNMKRKDAGVAIHGFSIFLDPKRIKLQDYKIPDMMEEDETLPHAPAATAPTIVPDQVITGSSGGKSPEPPIGADQDTATAPMDVEADAGQHQPQAQHAAFWSGFF